MADNPVFTCRLASTQLFVKMLKTISFAKKKEVQKVIVKVIDGLGIFFMGEMHKSMQAHCFLKETFFNSFKTYFSDTNVIMFCINLNALLDCLTQFTQNCHMVMDYFELSKQVSLTISDQTNDNITECNLNVYQYDDTMDIDLGQSINRCNIKSSYLKDIFNEIDALSKNDDVCSVKMIKPKHDNSSIDIENILNNNDNERKDIIINDMDMDMDIDIDNNNNNNNNNNNANNNEPGGLSIGVTTDVTEFSSYIPLAPDIMHEFEIKCNAEHRYRMNLIRPALKAVIKSTQTRINLNNLGILSIQYIIDPENNAGSWTKYIIIPLSADNDTESNDEDASFF